MNSLVSTIFGGRLRLVLIISFALVAVLTVSLSAIATSRVIGDYLKSAEVERVNRDMVLAEAFYNLKLEETAAISHRLVLDRLVIENLAEASDGREEALRAIDQQITNKIAVLALGGTHLIAVLDAQGDIVVSRVLSSDGELYPVIREGNWYQLPIVKQVLASGEKQAATEILPKKLLSQVGLESQAHIKLVDTPKAATMPYDAREGTAGLALTGVAPMANNQGEVIGAVLAAYIFNNDFTLVDRIKEVAGIDTVTIFFGDMRVSTNVMTEDNQRAVGTRVSQEVYDVVLRHDQEYVGEAFVVRDTYITRYKPLHNYLNQVVGILYVGALKSKFLSLVDKFYQRVFVIAGLSILLAALIAIPIAHFITRPITKLVEANQRLAQGDMNVRVQAYGNGELSVLGHSFNSMAEKLNQTQKELLQKEKLASMGQLAAGVAHEINNPLGTILLFSDMMYKEASENDPRRDDLKMILNETTRCKSIVADLLNFARQQEVSAQEVDIHSLLENVVSRVKMQPIYENIEIDCQFNHEIPCIQADPDQLQQVFVNLLNNAAESMDGKGTITLKSYSTDDLWVNISVSDTGVGIPDEYLDRLFTPFFTTKTPGRGTGLGLSISYGIVKMHHGNIFVQSEVGHGTNFTITLPVRLPQGRFASQTSTNAIIG